LAWLHAGVAGDTQTYTGLEIAPLAISVALLACLSGVAGTVSLVTGRTTGLPLAIGALAILAVTTSLFVLIAESVATAVPHWLLPVSARRATAQLSAGPGPWVVAGIALTALLAATPWTLAPPDTRTRLPRLPGVSLEAVAALALVGAIALLGWLRYENWLAASAGPEEIRLDGWTLPWIGPMSLLAVWGLVAALALCLANRTLPAALIAATAGWLVSFASSIALVVTNSLATVELDRFTTIQQSMYSPDFEALGAPWAFFALGLVTAGIGAALVALPRSRTA
jgi:hypothetical protein